MIADRRIEVAEDACPTGNFAACRARFEEVISWASGEGSAGLAHGELEAHLQIDARETFRQVLQDVLDLRAKREARLDGVLSASGVAHRYVEDGHHRALESVFGTVVITRAAYRHRGEKNLCPADGALNLPVELQSHGLRRLAAIESTRESVEGAVEAIERSTGVAVGKRQVEELTQKTAADFEAFYETRRTCGAEPGEVLVLSADGKGIVMRPDALRKETAKAAARGHHKLHTRLSGGEKRNRKRMAEIGAVYDLKPVRRSAGDVLSRGHDGAGKAPKPKATNKWCVASVVDDIATVITAVFDEADRRDPNHQRAWVALVDGNNHQIDTFAARAAARNINLPILIDFIHVLEYIWAAAWCFFDQGDRAAEAWVNDKALEVLSGKATLVAAAIRRKATYHHLDADKRANADRAADYLTAKAPHLDYPTALAEGWPIATGIIEGACRHIVADRMDRTGARWGLAGAEAVLKLRTLRSNGDFDDYFAFHTRRERQRIHETRYASGLIPTAA
jgi:hypothetical protein